MITTHTHTIYSYIHTYVLQASFSLSLSFICPKGSTVAGTTSVAFKNLPKSTMVAATTMSSVKRNQTNGDLLTNDTVGTFTAMAATAASIELKLSATTHRKKCSQGVVRARKLD